MRYNHVSITAFGYELPPNVVTSDDLEKRLAPLYAALHFKKGQLEALTGIRERRFWDPGTRPSDAAILAGRKALVASGVAAAQIDCLVFSAVSRDMMEPATASFVHNGLGLEEQCLVFDSG